MNEIGYFYILTNIHHTVLYCGATNDLYRRIQEHKNKIYTNSFSARYNREKQVKGGSRKKKIILIESTNPKWKYLFDTIFSGSGEELIRIKKLFK